MPLKLRLLLALLGFTCAAILPAADPVAPAPAARPPVLVTVHGAWAGGWHFKKVAPLLEAQGWKVCRPSLSGLGEVWERVWLRILIQTIPDAPAQFSTGRH